MSPIWILFAFWLGAGLGFVVFALMQVSRDGYDKSQHAFEALSSMPSGTRVPVARRRY